VINNSRDNEKSIIDVNNNRKSKKQDGSRSISDNRNSSRKWSNIKDMKSSKNSRNYCL
jgi:hypothetical protein